MNDQPSTSKQNVSEFEDEIFEDSTILANFNNSSFQDKTSRVSANHVNDSLNKSGLNVSALCCDEEISGYDKLTGQTWVYPTNYPLRDYQFNIIKAAILKNTLVSLPTGLGKTFIAAVIMYNFYRWYPLGKIVFTAPTRPLVAQQIDACYNIVAIPQSDTIEMTGHMQANTRKTHWQNKRVFFATPQVIYNDIKSGICPANLIRCLVIDEAHRARGNYAYCQIMGTLTDMGHKTYRVLALSATPGSKVEDVIQVIKNLHIAHLELRTENCIDVAPYSHARRINTVIIPLGPELTQLRQDYVEIMDGYARRLKQLNILPHNLGNLSKGRIVMLYKEFQSKERGARHPQHNYIMKDFTLLIALYHGLELLIKHGSRVFLNFFDEHPEKSWIQSDDNLTVLLERLRDDLGINPLALDRSILPDGTVPEMPQNLCFGHPKFIKLKELMMEHFTCCKQLKQDTRAIVFCEYRESVNLVHCLLLQCRPLIVPVMFVGQGASGKDGKTVISQKQQLRVMRSFREGGCNTLVATCVAEEGLDVGSVDLIVCFDISTRSPVRLVQRCGRTGRERGGQVHILVTEGREHQTLLDCMRQRDGLNKKIQQSKEVQASLYAANARMVPHGFMPQVQKMHLTVTKSKRDGDTAKKGQKDLRTMLLGTGRASSSGSNSSNVEASLITEDEFKEIFPQGYWDTNFFQQPDEYWSKSKETVKSATEHNGLKLSTWLEWQRTLQTTVNVGHSKDSEILSSLLQYSDAKRFELPPSTQNPSFGTQDFASQKIIPSPSKLTTTKVSSLAKVTSPSKPKQTKKKPKIPLIKSPGKKDGDIRALFSTATKSTKSYTKLINDLGIKNDGSIPTALINLLVDLSLNNNNNVTKKCYICASICDCKVIKNLKSSKNMPPSLKAFVAEPKFPDIDLIDDIDAETIIKCSKKDISLLDTQDVAGDVSYLNNDKNEQSKNFELEFDFDSSIDLTSPDNKINDKVEENYDKNFDIGDIEDIFADSSPEEAIAKEVKNEEKKSNAPNEALGFFGLDSIDDIFADSDDSLNNNITKTPRKIYKTPEKALPTSVQTSVETPPGISKNKQNIGKKSPQTEVLLSPSILSGKARPVPTSPILCSQIRKYNLSTKKTKLQSSTPVNTSRRCLIPNATASSSNIILTQNDKSKTPATQTSQMDTTNKSMFTITQLVEMINKTGEQSMLSKSHGKNENHLIKEDERSTSPILLSQVNKKKSISKEDEIITSPILLTQTNKKVVNPNNSLKKSANTSITQRKVESLIILESDSESENEANDTQVYDVDEIIESQNTKTPQKKNDEFRIKISPVDTSPGTNKRKLTFMDEDDDDLISKSPFFNKRQRIEQDPKKFTLQQRVLAALTSNKAKKTSNNDDTSVNFMVSPIISSQKENKNPLQDKIYENLQKDNKDVDKEEYIRKNNLSMLQMFRRDSKIKSPKAKFDSILNSRENQSQITKRQLTFDDSDDDFVEANNERSRRPVVNGHRQNGSITNHKVRKKKPKPKNDLLDLEADLSDDQSDSGDELSDDSAGSIADFICDDNLTHHEDMHAHYIRSVKSPVKGVFKIPELPKKFAKEDIFSQFVVDDDNHYEMDSFCVDSRIELTQANEMTELEVAEMLLEQKRRAKKKRARSASPEDKENDDSPVVRRRRNVKRKIQSDSDDSS